jgi:hypothetical protein
MIMKIDEDIIQITFYIGIGLLGLGVLEMIINKVKAEWNICCTTKWIRNAPHTHLVRETIKFTNDILYKKQITQFPTFSIRYCKHKKWAGMYNGEVIIYLKSNPDIPALVNTVLHEVMHYVQSKTDKQYKRYDEYTSSYGYWNNPFEIEARAFADKHCESCLKYLESKQLIKKV